MQIFKFSDMLDNITDRINKPIESELEEYVGLEHLDTDEININRFGSTNDVKATKLLAKKGDIIFGKRNAYLRKIAITNRGVVVSAHAMILRCKNLDKYDILTYYLQSSEFWKIAYSISEGSMSPTIKWKNLCNKEIILPDEYVENKILSILDKVQENIDVTRQFLDENTILKQGLMNKLLTKGIGHKKFKKVKLLDAKRWNEKAGKWEDQFEEVPEEWEVNLLGKLLKSNPQYGAAESAIDYDSELPRYVRITDINDSGNLKQDSKKSARLSDYKNYLLKQGDIVIARTGSIGISYHYNQNDGICIFAGFLIRFQLGKSVDTTYMKYYLQNNHFWNWINSIKTGTTRGNVNATDYKNLPVILPHYPEQKAIAEILSNVDEQISLTEKKIEILKKLKKKLIDDIFSGRMEIKE